MTTRDFASSVSNGTCALCRALKGKPLSVPPHPLLSLAGTDIRTNRFRCADCDLVWLVDVVADGFWDSPVEGSTLTWFPRQPVPGHRGTPGTPLAKITDA